MVMLVLPGYSSRQGLPSTRMTRWDTIVWWVLQDLWKVEWKCAMCISTDKNIWPALVRGTWLNESFTNENASGWEPYTYDKPIYKDMNTSGALTTRLGSPQEKDKQKSNTTYIQSAPVSRTCDWYFGFESMNIIAWRLITDFSTHA